LGDRPDSGLAEQPVSAAPFWRSRHRNARRRASAEHDYASPRRRPWPRPHQRRRPTGKPPSNKNPGRPVGADNRVTAADLELCGAVDGQVSHLAAGRPRAGHCRYWRPCDWPAWRRCGCSAGFSCTARSDRAKGCRDPDRATQGPVCFSARSGLRGCRGRTGRCGPAWPGCCPAASCGICGGSCRRGPCCAGMPASRGGTGPAHRRLRRRARHQGPANHHRPRCGRPGGRTRSPDEGSPAPAARARDRC
jgi:hypothetical protein